MKMIQISIVEERCRGFKDGFIDATELLNVIYPSIDSIFFQSMS